MNHLPEFKQRLKIWPVPGRKVAASQTPILDGGRWLEEEGEEVEWSPFRHRQLLAGEISLHDPREGAKVKHAFGGAHNFDGAIATAQARQADAEAKRAAAKQALAEADAADASAEEARKAVLAASARVAAEMTPAAEKAAPSTTTRKEK